LRRTGRRRDGHVQPGAGVDAVRLHGGGAVDEHVAGADELGRPGAGEAEQAGQGSVEPLARQPLGHGQLTPVSHPSSIPDRGGPRRIVPVTTFQSWGSSSRLTRRSSRPNGVTRGSSLSLKRTPLPSDSSHSASRWVSASTTMVRNLKTVKTSPSRPTRTWRK